MSARAVLPLSARELSAAEGLEVVTWRYSAPWSGYDVTEPLRDEDGFRALQDATGALVAFTCTGAEARVPGMTAADDVLDVGWGLRPDLTGQGLGREVVLTAAAEALRRSRDRRLRCVVQAWNERGLRAARAGGFVPVAEHTTPSESTPVRYVVLELARGSLSADSRRRPCPL